MKTALEISRVSGSHVMSTSDYRTSSPSPFSLVVPFHEIVGNIFGRFLVRGNQGKLC